MVPILFTAYLPGVFDYVEGLCPGVHGLSLMDDVAWWAEVMLENNVAGTLNGRAAEVMSENNVAGTLNGRAAEVAREGISGIPVWES